MPYQALQTPLSIDNRTRYPSNPTDRPVHRMWVLWSKLPVMRIYTLLTTAYRYSNERSHAWRKAVRIPNYWKRYLSYTGILVTGLVPATVYVLCLVRWASIPVTWPTSCVRLSFLPEVPVTEPVSLLPIILQESKVLCAQYYHLPMRHIVYWVHQQWPPLPGKCTVRGDSHNGHQPCPKAIKYGKADQSSGNEYKVVYFPSCTINRMGLQKILL